MGRELGEVKPQKGDGNCERSVKTLDSSVKAGRHEREVEP